MIKLTLEKLELQFENVEELTGTLRTLRDALGNAPAPEPAVLALPAPEKTRQKKEKIAVSMEIKDAIRARLLADPDAMNSDLAREFNVSASVAQGIRLGLGRRAAAAAASEAPDSAERPVESEEPASEEAGVPA